jgi:hypothetical protein
MAEKKKYGRKPLVFTEKDRRMVKACKAAGLTINEICDILSADRTDGTRIGKDQLYKHFETELKTAAPMANSNVAQALYKSAVTRGNVAAQKYWLQCRAGWKQDEEQKAQGDRPVSFTLNINGKLQDVEPDAAETEET